MNEEKLERLIDAIATIVKEIILEVVDLQEDEDTFATDDPRDEESRE